MSELLALSDLENTPIPLEIPSVQGWKEVPIKECDESLSPLGPFSGNDEIFTSSLYAGERIDSPYISQPMEGSLITMFVRQEVTSQLRTALGLLPKGMFLVVYDAYRPLQVQQSLFTYYYNALKELYPDWSDEDLLTESQRYVSLPSEDPSKPSPHNTGGSVDLSLFTLPKDVERELRTIKQQIDSAGGDWEKIYLHEMRRLALVKNSAQMLNFGTFLDYGGHESTLNYFEQEAVKRNLTVEEREAQKNRRILYHVMLQASFEPYADEWWHFNSKKSQMGARTSGLSIAEYGAASFSQENKKHEEMRRMHRSGSIVLLDKGISNKLGIISKELRVAHQAVRETGDIRTTSLFGTAIISPTKHES